MRIAIATDENSVSQHFGHAGHYTVFDMENDSILNRELVANPGHRPHYIPKFLNERGVNQIICGGMGQRARELFSRFNIEVITGIDGDIEEIIGLLLSGTLEGTENLCNHKHGHGHNEHAEHAGHCH